MTVISILAFFSLHNNPHQILLEVLWEDNPSININLEKLNRPLMITTQNNLALSHVLVFNFILFGMDCIFELLFIYQAILVI